jgi:hypothetical protein
MLHPGDAQDPDVANDIMLLPDTETLADRPKPCLAEVASLPRDWARLFDGQLFCIGEKDRRACSRSAHCALAHRFKELLLLLGHHIIHSQQQTLGCRQQ